MNKRYDDMVKYAESINKPVTNVEICKAMASLGKIFNPSSILEPHSGMGEILYYCDYGHTIDAYSSDKDAIVLGRDVDNRINFVEENFLFAKIDKKYDLVIAQIPFTHGPDPVTKREEFRDLNYIEKILKLLKEDGVFVGLLPGRFSFDDYSLKMRELIMKNYSLEMVVELPYEDYKVGAHNVNIVVIKNKAQRDNVLIVDYNENIDEIIHRYFLGEGNGFISKDLLNKRWNKYYHGNEFNWLNSYEPSKYLTLGEVARIISGSHNGDANIKEEGDLILIDRDNMVNGRIVPSVKDKYIVGDINASLDYVLRAGDIVVNMAMDGYCNVARYDGRTEPAITQFRYNIIRSQDEYFREFMNTQSGISFFEDYLNRHVIPPNNRVDVRDIKKFQIPVFDSEDLVLIEKKYKNSLEEEDVFARLNRIREELGSFRSSFQSKHMEDEKDQRIKELEESINVIGKLHAEGNQELISLIAELRSELKEQGKILVDIQTKVNDIHSIVTKLYEIQGDIQEKLNKTLDEEEREKAYVELSNRIWNLINENYEIKRSQNYDKIKEEYKEKFTEEGWRKLDEATQTYLITGRIVYEDLKHNDKLDFSPSCIALTKALERELFIHLFDKMKKYFGQDEGRCLDTLPDGIIYKSGGKTHYQKDNYYSLGKIPFILAEFFNDKNISNREKNIKKESLREFLNSGVFGKDSFNDANMDEYTKDLALKVHQIARDYRNEAAHKNAVGIIQANECYNLIIDTEQVLIEFINKLA